MVFMETYLDFDGAWYGTGVKVLADQTVWSLYLNACYSFLIGTFALRDPREVWKDVVAGSAEFVALLALCALHLFLAPRAAGSETAVGRRHGDRLGHDPVQGRERRQGGAPGGAGPRGGRRGARGRRALRRRPDARDRIDARVRAGRVAERGPRERGPVRREQAVLRAGARGAPRVVAAAGDVARDLRDLPAGKDVRDRLSNHMVSIKK